MKKTVLFIFVFLIIVVNPYSVFSKDKINVSVSIPPMEDILRNIGGDRVNINTLIKPGEDAHSFDPRPTEIISFTKADVFFISNIEFERNLIDKIKKIKPRLKIFAPGTKIKKILAEHECSGERHVHNHLIEDIHIWNSLRNLLIMANEIAGILCEISPEDKEYFEKNLKDYTIKIEKLHEEITENFSKLESRKFMVFHPSWNYFARDYNLEQIAVEVNEKEPGPRDLKELIDTGIQKGIKTIIISPNFGSVAPEIIAKAIKADLKEINPIPDNILEELRKLSDLIKK